MAKPTRIIVPRKGIAAGDAKPRAVYNELSIKVIARLGKTETNRASHVEPGSGLSHEALLVLKHDKPELVVMDLATAEIHPDVASCWFADMTPTGHDVVLGPWPPGERDNALAAEVKWLHDHNIPTCESCTAAQEAEEAEDYRQHLSDAELSMESQRLDEMANEPSGSYSDIARDGRLD